MGPQMSKLLKAVASEACGDYQITFPSNRTSSDDGPADYSLKSISQGWLYGLSIRVSRGSQVEMPTQKVMIVGGGTCGKLLGYEAVASALSLVPL